MEKLHNAMHLKFYLSEQSLHIVLDTLKEIVMVLYTFDLITACVQCVGYPPLQSRNYYYNYYFIYTQLRKRGHDYNYYVREDTIIIIT